MTSDSDPKESAHERAARLEAMLDEIKDEPSDASGGQRAAAATGSESAQSGEAEVAPPPVADVSTPDLDQLDADWGDMNADESAKHGLVASPRAAAVAARADLGKAQAVKADVPTSPKPVETDDMLGGYADDEDDDDYSAKTVIGRVPDLVALTRNQADAPLRTNLKTPRAAPVEVSEPQRDVPTIRPEPKVVIDPEADFSSVAPPPVIPPAGALPGNLPRRPLSDPPNDEPTRMAPLVLDSTPPPRSPTSRSVPPPEKDPAARAAEKAAAEARAAARKAKERTRIEALRERKKARAEAIAKKQKAKQPRRSRPPPPPDSESDAGGATLDSIPPDAYVPGDSLASTGTGLRAHARALPLARDWRKMAMLVVIVIALGAIVLALVTRR